MYVYLVAMVTNNFAQNCLYTASVFKMIMYIIVNIRFYGDVSLISH